MFVRTSKFRHIFSKEFKKEESFVDLDPIGGDSNWISVNEKYYAVCWRSFGGGQFYVGDINKYGKLSPSPFMYKGHKGPVLDVQFSPFDTNLLASVSEDCSMMLWRIPEGEQTTHITDPLVTLRGHSKKVSFVKFNPIAENLIATSSHDGTIKIWDLVEAKELITLEGFENSAVQHFDWSYNGEKIVATSSDGKVRVFDPRKSNQPLFSVVPHSSKKMSRCCWLGARDWFITVGFNNRGQREFCIWNGSEKTDPYQRVALDNSASQLLPFFDNDTSIFFLAGRGDGNIFSYEIVDEEPYCHELTQHRSSMINLGMAMLPKYACNIYECEIARMYKVTKSTIVPISWFVPRRTTGVFQSDIFPMTRSSKAMINCSEWLRGASEQPELLDLKERVASIPQAKEVVFKKQGMIECKPFDLNTEDIEALKDRIRYLESIIEKMN